MLENNFPGGTPPEGVKVCDAANLAAPDVNDVVSSMGVVFSPFTDIARHRAVPAGQSPGSRR